MQDVAQRGSEGLPLVILRGRQEGGTKGERVSSGYRMSGKGGVMLSACHPSRRKRKWEEGFPVDAGCCPEQEGRGSEFSTSLVFSRIVLSCAPDRALRNEMKWAPSVVSSRSS